MGTKFMFDTATARRMMVDGQVRTADVTDLDLIAAMAALPRERFVPAALAEQAYRDGDIAISDGRVLLKPMVLAKLIQAARVRRDDHVLDVGCGTGYSSAVLARLAGSVVALEEDAALARQAKATLAATDGSHVTVAIGRSARLHFRPRAYGQSHDLPPDRRPIGRPPGVRCGGARAAGLCRPAGIRLLRRPRREQRPSGDWIVRFTIVWIVGSGHHLWRLCANCQNFESCPPCGGFTLHSSRIVFRVRLCPPLGGGDVGRCPG
jgi:SAM-dependent methyltransferase